MDLESLRTYKIAENLEYFMHLALCGKALRPCYPPVTLRYVVINMGMVLLYIIVF